MVLAEGKSCIRTPGYRRDSIYGSGKELASKETLMDSVQRNLNSMGLRKYTDLVNIFKSLEMQSKLNFILINNMTISRNLKHHLSINCVHATILSSIILPLH